MAILFQSKKNITFYIIGIIFVLSLAILTWFVLRRVPTQHLDDIIEETITQRQEDVKIDFSSLENKLLEELDEFHPIIPVKEGYGRDNPFEPKE